MMLLDGPHLFSPCNRRYFTDTDGWTYQCVCHLWQMKNLHRFPRRSAQLTPQEVDALKGPAARMLEALESSR